LEKTSAHAKWLQPKHTSRDDAAVMESEIKTHAIIEGGNAQTNEWYVPVPQATRIKIPDITGEFSVLELIASHKGKLVGRWRRIWNNLCPRECTLPKEAAGKIFFPMMLATADGRVYAQRNYLLAKYSHGTFDGQQTIKFLAQVKPELANKVSEKYIKT